MSSGKRIVVVGAGAIGGYTGALMARGGEDVTLIDPWPEHVEYIRRHGMQLSGLTPREQHSIPVPAMHIGDVQQLGDFSRCEQVRADRHVGFRKSCRVRDKRIG